jgi:hypothetical protein
LKIDSQFFPTTDIDNKITGLIHLPKKVPADIQLLKLNQEDQVLDKESVELKEKIRDLKERVEEEDKQELSMKGTISIAKKQMVIYERLNEIIFQD